MLDFFLYIIVFLWILGHFVPNETEKYQIFFFLLYFNLEVFMAD